MHQNITRALEKCAVPLTLRAGDLESIIRLAIELRDFAAGSDLQRRHFLAAMGKLVGAPIAIWHDMHAAPQDRIVTTRAYDQGTSDDERRTRLSEYLATQSEVYDPTLAPMKEALQFGSVVAKHRRQLVSDRTWYPSHHFEKFRRGPGHDDCIYSAFIGPSGFQTFSLHRPLNDKRFTDSDAALVAAIHAGCTALLDDQELRIVNALSPRLRETFGWLLRGLTDKQVACELDVSPHTLHGYLKTLYRKLGVSSRFELLARYGRVAPVERARTTRP